MLSSSPSISFIMIIHYNVFVPWRFSQGAKKKKKNNKKANGVYRIQENVSRWDAILQTQNS